MDSKKLLRICSWIVAAILLASCVATPDKLFEDGERYRYIGQVNAIDTGWCLVRVTEEIESTWKAHIKKPQDVHGTTEVIVQNIIGKPTAIAVAQLTPLANGSEVMLWVHRKPPYGSQIALRTRFISDCSINT